MKTIQSIAPRITQRGAAATAPELRSNEQKATKAAVKERSFVPFVIFCSSSVARKCTQANSRLRYRERMARIPILPLSVLSVKSVVENASHEALGVKSIQILQEANRGRSEDAAGSLLSLGSSPVKNKFRRGSAKLLAFVQALKEARG